MKYPKTTILISLLIVFLVVNYLITTKNSSPLLTTLSPKNLPSPVIKKESESIKLLAFGDLMLGRHVETLISRGENMFENIKQLNDNPFNEKDYILVNLENPITNSEISQEKSINLKMSPQNVSQLTNNGINLVSLANNHIEDYFQTGIDDTLYYLDLNLIEHFGIQNQPLIKDKNGIRLAFFGINALWGEIEPFFEMIKEIKKEVDYVIIFIHWGEEYNSSPSKRQTELGHKLIDSGAHLILGSHPHTTQPIENYNNGVIFYSLGNFIFDQLDPITAKELGVEINIEKNKINFHLLPMTVKNFKPEFLPLEESSQECLSLTSGIISDDECSFSIETRPN